MILEFDVVLDTPNRIHFSGDDVTGHVILKLDSPLPLRCVMVKFIGEAKYKIPSEFITLRMHHNYGFNKKKKGRRKTRNNKVGPAPIVDAVQPSQEKQVTEEKPKREMRASSETYFDKGIYLFGHKYSSFREHLSEGFHKFPFKYTLPASLPTAFTGRFSYIRYYCEALLERWGNPIEKRRTYFCVSHIADINNEPKADLNCDITRTTNCWLLCCPRGTIVVTTRLKKLGVVPGQKLPLETDIHNMSTMYISEIFVSVIQVTTYYSNHGAVLYEDENIVRVSNNGPVQQGDFVILNEGIKLPPLPPTTFGHICCKIISISYKVQVQVEFARGNKPIIIKMPLIVGNIPFKKDFKLFERNSNLDTDSQIKMPNIFNRMPEFPTAWSGIYEDSSQNESNQNQINNKNQFIPRYPYYKLYHKHHNQNNVLSNNHINEILQSNDNVTNMTDLT